MTTQQRATLEWCIEQLELIIKDHEDRDESNEAGDLWPIVTAITKVLAA